MPLSMFQEAGRIGPEDFSLIGTAERREASNQLQRTIVANSEAVIAA